MESKYYTNPLCEGADPWVIKDGNDYYYCFSVGDGVAVRKCDGIDNLAYGECEVVYKGEKGTMFSDEYWAPELHKVNGKWYIYVAASNGDNYNHRMYVLEGTDESPLKPFVNKGKITDETDKWAIDGTLLQYDNKLYFIWSGWEGNVNVSQNIYIAPMSDPTTISGERVMLSKPESDWEMHGRPLINEGPVAVCKQGKVFIIYSASGSWTDHYCLGQLMFESGDILDPQNWVKSKKPVFSAVETAYGPGHCSFTESPSGEDYIVYHANEVSGTSWGGRSVRAQKVQWTPYGLNAGTPVKAGVRIEIK